MDRTELKKVVEALIFASEGPITLNTIAKIIEGTNGVDLQDVLQELNEDYANSGHSLQIVHVAGGVQITTRPEYARWVKKLYQGRTSQRLSHAALEAFKRDRNLKAILNAFKASGDQHRLAGELDAFFVENDLYREMAPVKNTTQQIREEDLHLVAYEVFG